MYSSLLKFLYFSDSKTTPNANCAGTNPFLIGNSSPNRFLFPFSLFLVFGSSPLGSLARIEQFQIGFVIPPASGDRWSRAFVKSSTQHPFNPISSNSPGGGVPFLLPRVQNPGVECGRSLQNPFLLPSWSSSFFHHFSNLLLYRFLLHFGSQLGAKIVPKSVKNRSQECSQKLPTF